MAYEFYVTIEGTKQGKFKSDTPRERHTGKIPGISFDYSVKSPRDAASGQASGKRTHQPLKFISEMGAHTPQTFQALCTNEVLKSVLFEFVKTDKNGEEYVYHTIKLVNATVSEMRNYNLADAKTNASHDVHELQETAFTFQRIEMESKDGKTMAVDDWNQGK